MSKQDSPCTASKSDLVLVGCRNMQDEDENQPTKTMACAVGLCWC